MKRPEVIPTNHEAVYDYYRDLAPNARQLRMVHRLSSVYAPSVQFEDGAEERIGELLEDGTRLIMGSNHINMFDQLPVAAVVQQEDVLRPVRGNTFILSKPSYFQNRLLRPVLDNLGAVPIFREKDVTEDEKDAFVEAGKSLIALSSAKIAEGSHMFIFPEGTRNTGDPAKVGEIQKGIGRMVCEVPNEVPVAVLPIGIWYDGLVPAKWLTPRVEIGKPIEGPFENPFKFMKLFRPALRQCVEDARVRSAAQASLSSSS